MPDRVGPRGDDPLGVGPRSLLGPEEELELPARGRGGGLRHEVLGWWLLSRRAARRLESANDLALDGRRGLLLVSSLSHRIARIATPLDPAEHEAAVDDDWRVPEPGGGRSRPEALSLAPRAVLVGYDRRDAGDNLAMLEPLG